MKRVICCLDGTWNNSHARATRTNVHKLWQAIAVPDAAAIAAGAIEQVKDYVEGIASTDGETAQFLKGAVGFGVEDRIRTAYEFLCRNYAAGDEVFLFGFSRGAFEARSLGGFIGLVGLARALDRRDFDKAWALYRQNEAGRSEADLAEIRSKAHYPVRIACMGVWDTVGNIGNPFFSDGLLSRHFEFHDMRLTETIKVGLHALSVDEVRGPFRPSLWMLPKDRQLAPDQDIQQVWFAGNHADVGGGYGETSLSDITLLWMAEQAEAKTGLVFDKSLLSNLTRPDPLGPQHSETVGPIFSWSASLPYIRLIKQASSAISETRRALIGNFRSSLVPAGMVTVNESIHESVHKRLGERVNVLLAGEPSTIVYRPANLLAVLPGWERIAPKPAARVGQRRIKIFTVHGTFAHKADWDDWDAFDATRPPGEQFFVNRLSRLLRDRGVTLEAADHSQFEWSGGNSHDERRAAALELKKAIETELKAVHADPKRGPGYYEAVYVIGHSHGGTVARLAMNLWDRSYDYYEPIGAFPNERRLAIIKSIDPFGKKSADEIERAILDAHYEGDDACPHCLRERSGKLRPAAEARPDGVITFGSPFVTFEKRRANQTMAIFLLWVSRIMLLIPTLIWAIVSAEQLKAAQANAAALANSSLLTIMMIVAPAALYWLWAIYVPRIIMEHLDYWLGKGTATSAICATLFAIKMAGLAFVAWYYWLLLGPDGSWAAVTNRLPDLKNPVVQSWVVWATPIVLYWLFAVSIAGRIVKRLGKTVGELREKLPQKYDPRETRPVRYLSYLTPGDEAGLHLRVFGFVTWLIQSLGVAAAVVLAFGLVLGIAVGSDMFTNVVMQRKGWSILAYFGLSPYVPAHWPALIELYNGLTAFPAAVWHALYRLVGADPGPLQLSEAPSDILQYLPGAVLFANMFVVMILVPMALALVGIAYLISMALRGSGLVFGSEHYTWSLANRIGVARRANDNTMLKMTLISPEAWWKRQLAHCYYYHDRSVTEDLAQHLSDWNGRHRPNRGLPVERWLGNIASSTLTVFSILTIFVLAIVLANKQMQMTRQQQESKAGAAAVQQPVSNAPPTHAPAAAPEAPTPQSDPRAGLPALPRELQPAAPK